MKILWLSHVIPYPPKAGVLSRAYHLLRAVATSNDLDLVAFIQEPLLKTFYPSVDDALRDCRKELTSLCRSVTFLPIEKLSRPCGKQLTAFTSLFTPNGYMARWLEGQHARAVLRRLAQESTYDFAHLDCISLACYRSLLGAIPATLGHHNAESHMLLRRATTESNPLRSWYFRQEGRRLSRYESRQSDLFAAQITCSDLDTARLQHLMPTAHFITIPNGVDVEYFRPIGLPPKSKSFIFVSSMNWYPNVDAALFLLKEIWPAISRRIPDAKLDIIGSSAPQSVIEAAQSINGVTLHGYVPDIRPIVDLASLYICPVRDGGGTKLKVLDAFAMGKCVIAHPVACEGLNVEPGRNVVFATDPEEFASRAQELTKNPGLRAQIGAAARELAAGSYSFDAIGRELVRAFEELRSPGGAQPLPRKVVALSAREDQGH
jgi:glycosyltransferase involved in cell wall biosynthesis